MDFYQCEKSGVVFYRLNDAECDGPKKLEANTTDAAQEKHVPEVKREGNKLDVQVGSVPHPMEEDHYIQFIGVVQGDKAQFVSLKPGQEPKASFQVEEGPATVYEFCNKHGLWKAEA